MFQDRPVFNLKYSHEDLSILTFRNNFQKSEEEKYFLGINEKAQESLLAKEMEKIGTISVITNLHVSGEMVYDMMKSRSEIEQS